MIVVVAGVLIGVFTPSMKNRTLTTSSNIESRRDSSCTPKHEKCCEQDCNEDAYYCKYPIGDCGATPSDAECVEIPEMCIERLYDPVCGCDEVTYSNECDAAVAGVSILSEGACPGDETVECEGNEDCSVDEFCQLSRLVRAREHARRGQMSVQKTTTHQSVGVTGKRMITPVAQN